ncbi:MAG: hypothetical protein AB1324_04930 [Candidatus Micrarchaeota archaeon]
MRIIAAFILGLMVFLAGCSSAPPVNNTPAPPANNTVPQQPMTCEEYCVTQPHVQCVGTWKISGTYPNCVCTFECAAENTTGNGEQEPPAANTTPPEPEEPLASPTDKTVKELLDDGLDKVTDAFYRENSGQFDERKYTWLRRPLMPDGSISNDMAPIQDVEFDDEPISTIQAFGYMVFEYAPDETKDAYAVAIFKAKSTPLDSYTGGDTFEIDYFPSQTDSRLRGCWSYSRDYHLDKNSEWLATYYIRCTGVHDK